MSGVFKVSLVDMIKKIRYNYEQPIDYIDTFIGHLYEEGQSIDILTSNNEIRVTSPGSIDGLFLQQVSQNKVLALASIIPPVKAYNTVHLWSSGRYISIDENRSVEVLPTSYDGTTLIISRMRDGSENKRIRELYSHSDMNCTLNGKMLNTQRADDYSFRGEFRGIIRYDPYEKGGLHFFYKGRHIASEDFINGLDLYLHGHGLKPTITKSRVLTKRGTGKKTHARLQEKLPKIILDYLKSDQVASIDSVASYQTILRSVLRKYYDNEEVMGFIREHLRLADGTGRINPTYTLSRGMMKLPPNEKRLYEEAMGLRKPRPVIHPDMYKQYCAELQGLLGMPVRPTDDSSHYDKKKRILFVSTECFEYQSLVQTALSLVNEQELPRKRRTLYKNIVRAYRGG